MTAQGVLTPNEFFHIHHCAVMDFMAGIFYLCWVPVPILFGLGLYFSRQRKIYLRLALVFLFVNLIGFVGYYIHPAAPPWYVMNYGFEPILNTPGDVAGLGRFDAMTGLTIFRDYMDEMQTYLQQYRPCIQPTWLLHCFILSGHAATTGYEQYLQSSW